MTMQQPANMYTTTGRWVGKLFNNVCRVQQPQKYLFNITIIQRHRYYFHYHWDSNWDDNAVENNARICVKHGWKL